MKKIYSILFPALAILMGLQVSGQANTKLSNLVAPTAINAPLLPNGNNTQTIGNSALAWKSLYLFDGLFLKGNLTMISPGTDNFFTGRLAGNATLTGTNNSGFGMYALNGITTGIQNTAVGSSALRKVNTGAYNTAVGAWALNANTSGGSNTAAGFYALKLNNGSSNTAYGRSALEINGSGGNNTAGGYYALYNNGIGNYNTAFGSTAASSNTSGEENTAVGYFSLQQNQTGIRNTAIGARSLNQTKTGHNTAVGYSAGYLYANGNYNTYVGAFSGSSAAGFTFSTAVGYFAKTTASNQVRIGTSSITSIGGYTNWTNISDGRFKKEVKEDVIGLDFINQLRPVTYLLDIKGIRSKIGEDNRELDPVSRQEDDRAVGEKEKIRYSGFIAQEVEKTANASKYSFSGVDVPKNDRDLYGLRYAEFVVPLVKAVQELSSANQEQKEKIKTLEKELDELKKMVAEVAGFQRVGRSLNDKTGGISQNVPNPGAGSTTISYSLPSDHRLAQLMVLDAAGKTVKKINLSAPNGAITLNTAMLASGTYTYFLLVDGAVIDTKKMILAR